MQALEQTDRRQLETRIAHLRSTLTALEEQLEAPMAPTATERGTVLNFPQQPAAAAETTLAIAAG